MNLGIFNNLFNNKKENSIAEKFIKELSDSLQVQNVSNDALYQVIEIDVDGAYLQNVNDNSVFKENNISKELLEKLDIDSVLRYENGAYIYEQELTEKFLDSLIGIKEYKDIQNQFIKDNNIEQLDSNTLFKLKIRNKDYCILSYENTTIKVPDALIPFWAKLGENLYYKNGKFNRI